MRYVASVLAVLIVVALTSALSVRADENFHGDKKEAKLTLPWKKLDSITDEQREQIRAIHKKALEEIRAVRQREEQEILAVLTDEQRAELQQIQDERNARRRDKQEKKKKSDDAAGEPTTQPSQD